MFLQVCQSPPLLLLLAGEPTRRSGQREFASFVRVTFGGRLVAAVLLLQVPEIAFTGDTTSAFLDSVPEDVLHARLLIMEMSFLDDSVSVEDVSVGVWAFFGGGGSRRGNAV